jgi:serine/threonine-protein kinase
MTTNPLLDPAYATDVTQAAPSAAGPVVGRSPVPPIDAASKSLAVLPRAQLTEAGMRLVAPGKSRYEVMRRLGAGAFGEVYLATDNDIDRRVAIKRIRPEALDEDAILRFTSEVQSVGRLEHPGIVPVHDVGRDDGGFFLVMKYVEGETLEDVIAKLRKGEPRYLERYTMEFRAELFIQLCHAVEFAHARGYIHRDIKPANVMVGPYGEVMLMDWGLAKKISETGAVTEMYDRKPTGQDPFGTLLGHAIGTPAYMAPEQARGEHDATDGRADIYSLCAVFFELLTLTHYLPPKRNVTEVLEAVKTEEPIGAIAIHHRFQVSPDLAWAVRKGLEKDRTRRYQSVAELCSRIQSVLEGKAPVQCPCTGLKRVNGAWGDFIDRHPNLAVCIALGFVLSAVTGVVNVVLLLSR